jgi:hypothetical protein
MKKGTSKGGQSQAQSIDTMFNTVDTYVGEDDLRLLYFFARYIRSEGDIVEAGSWKGKATIALCLGLLHSHKRGYMWSIDPYYKQEQLPEIDKKVFKQQLSTLHIDTKIREIYAPSSYATKRWKRPIRLLFIDGNHDYQSTAAEIAYWSSWVVTGGIIAFRDGYGASSGVWKAISFHIFSRKDIVNIGTLSSICYVVLGRPSWRDRYKVFIKKKLAVLAHRIHISSLSWPIKSFMVYTLISTFLSTTWNTRVYNQSKFTIPTFYEKT